MPRRLYHNSVYDASRPVPSYWESEAPPCGEPHRPLARDAHCEVAIVGGGYTGLSAALHLARDHGIEARVLEAGDVGWGASGRNGGFCGLAATKLSIAALIDRFGLDEAKRFFASQREGIDFVAALAEEEGIEIERAGSGNYEVAHAPRALAGLAEHAETHQRNFGVPVRTLSRAAFAEEAHDGVEQFGGIHLGVGFAINPLRFCRGLADAAARHGAVVHPHSKVEQVERMENGRYRLTTNDGSLVADRLVLAMNGFHSEGLRPALDGRVMPVLSNILTTRPLSEDELAAQGWKTQTPICNSRNLLFYYRMLPDRRLLIGARGDLTGSPESSERMRVWLQRRAGEIFPAWKEVEATHFWRGLVCMSRKFSPSIGRLDEDPNIWFGYGYHANGVNTAPWAGRLLARLIAGRASLQDVPAVLAGQAPRFPLPAFRPLYLSAAFLWYRLADAWT